MRNMRGGARLGAEQPVLAAVDAIARGAQHAENFRPVEIGRGRQVFFLGDLARPLSLLRRAFKTRRR